MIKIDKIITNITTDEERAFYNSNNIKFVNLKIDGPKDGESAFKECKDIEITSTYFNLRYPFWHNNNVFIDNCELTDKCRAAIWYSDNFEINNSKLNGIKVFRECKNITINKSIIDSKECFWKCYDVNIFDVTMTSEYPFFECKDMIINNLNMTGKYSFQYCENIVIKNSNLNTKDAFWGSKNITVMNSTIKGEYLAWYSENLRLINCTIIGTQPLCYCKNLILENCKMIDCDLAFEYSDVTAKILGKVDSIKNPTSGLIVCDDSLLIFDENFRDNGIKIIINKKQ